MRKNYFFKDCGSPKSIDNGNYTILMTEKVNVKGEIKEFVQIINYTCFESFIIAPWSKSILTCEGNLTSFDPPDCVICK